MGLLKYIHKSSQSTVKQYPIIIDNLFMMILGLVLMVSISITASAQNDIPLGVWRSHASYRSAHHVAVVENRVYCATKFGLFYFDIQEGSTTILSKVNGLSGSQIVNLAFSQDNNVLLIAYEDGNIDLITDDELVNVNTIALAELTDDKHVNEIEFVDNLALLSMELGMVILDVTTFQIVDTYSTIGPGGAKVKVNSSTIKNDSLYLATDKGILSASFLPAINRLDFRNWRQLSFKADTAINFIKNLSNTLLIGINEDSIYANNNGSWDAIRGIANQQIHTAQINEQSLYISVDEALISITGDLLIEDLAIDKVNFPKHIAIDNAGNFWIADEFNGLVQTNGSTSLIIQPNGPTSDRITSLQNYDGRIVGISGSIKDDLPEGNMEGFSVFEDGTWANYNSINTYQSISTPEINDLVDVVFNPSNGTTYFASFGSGILTWDNEIGFEVLNENTNGSTLINSSTTDNLTRVSSVQIDANGNLWLCNYATNQPIQFLTLEGEWRSISTSEASDQYIQEIIIPASNHLWMVIARDKGGRIIIADPENGNSDIISKEANKGQLGSNLISDIVEDNRGQIWLGTDAGIQYFQTSFDMLEASPKDFALRPFFENFPLLSNEHISAIKVDGGNRKWIGTDDGIWLFGENGESLTFRFTSENSPLPSDEILDIAIESTSGEVFIATDKGVVSFRSTATAGQFEHQQVKVFPNPVMPNFNGLIGISGLTSGARIKITDVSGKLIYETIAQGGTATWNGQDYNNRKASTGIYLIFSSNATGEQTYIGKIAVIE